MTLTATGGDRYLWSTGETTQSITVHPAATTKYTVTAYVGDSSATDDAVVNVSPNPDVKIMNGSEATILEGEFITLSASGAKSYQWSNGATKPNIAVSPRKTESFTVTGYDDNCSSQRSIQVNVFEKVVANAGEDVSIFQGEQTILSAKGPKDSKFLWSTGETTQTITVAPSESTEYSVMVYHELDSDTDSVMVNVNQIAQDQIAVEPPVAFEFLIHPNPTDGELNIKISGLSSVSSIHLYDFSGKSLFSETISDGDQSNYTKRIDLSDFATGIYLLQLVDNEKLITKKVVLK